MKYIRKFNESIDKEELRDFCETYLAYLLDNNEFKIYLSSNCNVISLVKGNREDNKPLNSPEFLFDWDEIKDQFIPFIHMLSRQYKITNFKFWDLNRKVTLKDDEKLFIDYDYDLSMVIGDQVSLENITILQIILNVT